MSGVKSHRRLNLKPAPEGFWRPLARWLVRRWRRVFLPPPERIPGQFPWKRPPPLPYGTVLIDPKGGRSGVYADGTGGWFFTTPLESGRGASQPRTR